MPVYLVLPLIAAVGYAIASMFLKKALAEGRASRLVLPHQQLRGHGLLPADDLVSEDAGASGAVASSRAERGAVFRGLLVHLSRRCSAAMCRW